MKNLQQPDDTHYQSLEYDTKERFASYWYQINLILSRNPGSVLEVGVGNKFINNYIKGKGINITSFDIDCNLKPNVAGSVLNLPFKKDSFDLVVCYQVLEHLPFESLKDALQQLAFAVKSDIFISVPDLEPYAQVRLRKCTKEYLQKYIVFPQKKKPIFVSDVGHYWEVGREGYPLSKVFNAVVASHLRIEHTFRLMDNMYHRFFLLKKADGYTERTKVFLNEDKIRLGNCESWRGLPFEEELSLGGTFKKIHKIFGKKLSAVLKRARWKN